MQIRWMRVGRAIADCAVKALTLSTFMFVVTSLLSAQTSQLSNQQSTSSHVASSMAAVHKHVDEKSVLVHNGDLDATIFLANHIFERVGMPPEIAFGLKYTQRLSQAEVDYRSGQKEPVHEEELVKAVNKFEKAIGAPAWSYTNNAEVRMLRMQMMARYPQFLAKKGPRNADGKYDVLDKNMGPMESMFLVTSLLFQKTYHPQYQLTDKERVAGGVKSVAKEEFQIRMQTMYRLLQGQTENVDFVDLQQATEGLFADLGIKKELRSDFAEKTSPIAQKLIEGDRK